MNIDIDMNSSRKGDRHKNKGADRHKNNGADRHKNNGADRHKKDAEGQRINKASLNLTQSVYSTYMNSLSPTSQQIFVDNKRKNDRERKRIKKLKKQNVELSNQLDNFRSSSSSSSSIDINNVEQQKQQRKKFMNL